MGGWHTLDVSFAKHPVVQRRSYSCDKKSTGEADRDISHLLGMFLQSCEENQNYASWALFAPSDFFPFGHLKF
jgi:hypothetical protein